MNAKALMIPAMAAGAILAAAGAASAAQVYDLDISYFNGDSFTGTVTLNQSPDTSSDIVNGTFDYFVTSGFGKKKTVTAESETIDKISTFDLFGVYNSTLSGPVKGLFPSFSYTFDKGGVPTPTKLELLDGVSSINISAVAGVPEPGEWAIMILGLFGMGLALRTRRAATLATAAAQA